MFKTAHSPNAPYIPERKPPAMTTENTSQPIDLNEETRAIWDKNATFWDDKMRDGNDFQRILVGPASERLLNLQPCETLLEIASSNGVFTPRMAQLVVPVISNDLTDHLLVHPLSHPSVLQSSIPSSP